MPLSDRIREARDAAGITQDELAHRLRNLGDPRLSSTTEKYVSLWENGSPRVAFYVIDALAFVLGVPLEVFSEWSSRRDGVDGRPVDPQLERAVAQLERAAADVLRRLREEGDES